MLSQKNSELKEKLFEEFASLVKDYKQTPAYTELLKNRILQAKDQASARGDEMIIYLDPEDADKQEALQQETGVTLQISQYGFGGGIRAVIPSRHILIDHSFDSKITELKENFHFHGGNVNG
jgi:vacuolar-type H+-ATPase subunit E/Vma4